jgi:hypothetical protein
MTPQASVAAAAALLSGEAAQPVQPQLQQQQLSLASSLDAMLQTHLGVFVFSNFLIACLLAVGGALIVSVPDG